MPAVLPDRFLKRVDMNGPYWNGSACWLWTGGTVNGYGRFYYEYRDRPAHRVSYQLLVGEIPIGLQLDHLCRVRGCVNPAHLEPVTRRENILRGEGASARCAAATHCPQGHPYAGANLYVAPSGYRVCRECRRQGLKRTYAKHPEKWAANGLARRQARRLLRNSAAPQVTCLWQTGLGPRCPYPATRTGLCRQHLGRLPVLTP